MKYQIIQRIPTMIGFTVDIAELPSGEQVIVKRVESEFEKSKLQDYIQHVLIMQKLLKDESIYPPLLYYSDDELVMPFFRYGQADKVADRATLYGLTGRALDILFRIAAADPTSVPLPNKEERRNLSQSYLVSEARARLQRLEVAFEHNMLAKAWVSRDATNGAMNISRMLEGLTIWITNGQLERLSPALAAPSLGLSSHGDFGLNNVLLREPASSEAALVFIDTRGRWYKGLPWWDPIMDLATLLAFHCRIEPALEALDVIDESDRVRHRLSETEILDLCSSCKGFQDWISLDPHWRERLQVHLAIRLLGNVSIQLTAAPMLQAERATEVFRLFAEQVGHVRDVLA